MTIADFPFLIHGGVGRINRSIFVVYGRVG